MADRKISVQVQIGGNSAGLNAALAQSQAQATALQSSVAQAGKIQSGGTGGQGIIAQTAAQAAAARAQTQAMQSVPTGIPIAQFAQPNQQQTAAMQSVPTARLWTQQDTLAERGQKRITDAETQLAYLRSGVGASATIQAMRAEEALARQQEDLARIARYGRIGSVAHQFMPLAQAGAGFGVGVATAAIAALPALSEQLSNSFRLLSGEIGMALVPAVTQFSAYLQQASGSVRTLSDSGASAGDRFMALGDLVGDPLTNILSRYLVPDNRPASARSLVNPQAQLGGDVAGLYERNLMMISGQPEALGEQDARSREAILRELQSINRNTQRVQET